jgi:hypothetical protein
MRTRSEHCPYCGAKNLVPESHWGRQITCKCGMRFQAGEVGEGEANARGSESSLDSDTPVPIVKVHCGQCGQRVSGDESFFGTVAKCPICSSDIRFPDAPSTESAPVLNPPVASTHQYLRPQVSTIPASHPAPTPRPSPFEESSPANPRNPRLVRAPVSPANTNSERVPCPSCAELVMRSATICPHCNQAIFSQDKATNAAAGCIISVILFFILYFLLTAFSGCEVDRMMRNL